MNTNHKMLVAIATLPLSINVLAFDTRTHAAMTSEAIKQSKITGSPNTSIVLKTLGLYDKDDVFKKRYIDIGSKLTSRNGTDFENDIRDKVRAAITDIPNPYTIPGWIIRGSIREDDNTEETKPGTPEGDEPDGVFKRVYGHFYDPQNDRGLTKVVLLGAKSVDWAIDKDAVANGRKNYYNVPSAREAMWRALTLKVLNPGGTLSTVPAIAGIAFGEDERNAYWATMFRAVGDVVHLLQDAAQPQHTRNDAHAGLGCVTWTGSCAAGHASFFENYVKARTLLTTTFTLDEGFANALQGSGTVRNTTAKKLIYDGYTAPTFSKYADYFSTGIGGGNASGKGLANYSNRGFFSAGTNIGSADQLNYPLPNPNVLTDTIISGPALVGMTGAAVGDGTATMKFKQGMVIDSISGAVESNVKLSAYGLFDQFLIEKNLAPQYTLNYYNYDEQARLLIPRAVAYSAGLIDYFFRGELEISLPDEGVYAVVDYAKESKKDTGGFNKVKLKLKNKTPDISPSGGGATVAQTLDPSGTVVAVAKFRRNKCYSEYDLQGEIPVYFKDAKTQQAKDSVTKYIFDNCRDPVEEIVVSNPVTLPKALANGDDPVPLTFEFNDRIPINVIDLYLQVVYRGKLGDEPDAVVVTTKDVSEPTFFKLTNYFWTQIISNGSCKFTEFSGMPSDARMKIALNQTVGAPYLIEADLNQKDYAMFAAISDIALVKARGEYRELDGQGSYGDPQMLGTTVPLWQGFYQEAQRVTDGTGAIVHPFYRQSQFYPTAPNTLTLKDDTPPAFTKIRGMFIDTGFYIADVRDLSGCQARPDDPYLPTEIHSLMQPHNPLVPRALFKVNF